MMHMTISGTSGGTGVQLHHILVAIIIGMLIGTILTALACCFYFKKRQIPSKIIMLHAHYFVLAGVLSPHLDAAS